MLILHALLITQYPCGAVQGIQGCSLGLLTHVCGAGVLRKTGGNGDFPMVVGAKQPNKNTLPSLIR